MSDQDPHQELENKPTAQKSTSTENKTKPKDPGRVSAGKRLAQLNKKRKEESEAQSKQQNENTDNEKNSDNDIKPSFTLTQVLSIVSIAVSLAGLYLKREELRSFFQPKQPLKSKDINSECTSETVKIQNPKSKVQSSSTKIKPMD